MSEKVEDTQGVIKAVNRRTENAIAKVKKGKRTNNNIQNTTQKTKD